MASNIQHYAINSAECKCPKHERS